MFWVSASIWKIFKKGNKYLVRQTKTIQTYCLNRIGDAGKISFTNIFRALLLFSIEIYCFAL